MKVDRRARTAIDLETSGDNTVVASPGAGKFIEIDHLDFLCSGGANTIRIKAGSSVIARYSLDDAQGYQFDFNTESGPLALDMDTGLVLNLYGSTQVEGLVIYRIVGE